MKPLIIISIVSIITGCAPSQSEHEKYNGIAKNEDMVCEHIASTGSHMKKKRCMTKELAAEVREKNQQAMKEASRKGRTSTTNQ
ncbi:hypothetical protein [Thalassotalea aquiviva]|uniref:hypothetical protein n=1 Tax=Thalassotalea aquiviva TaxID=3242415 RepID=UPI00352B9407